MKTNTYIPPKREVYAKTDFKNINILVEHPKNRLTAYSEEECEEALKNGFTETEIKSTKGIVKGILASLMTFGYLPTNPIRVFETLDGKFIIIDGHHLVRALKEYQKLTGKKISVVLLVYKENKNYTYEKACYEMVMMNREGATPWSFIDIMRYYNNKNANTFVELYAKYRSKVSAVAVVADAVLDKPTSTKRSTIDEYWATDKKHKVWNYAEDYLEMLTNINANRKISQTASDAFRKIYKWAIEFKVQDLFAAVFTDKDSRVEMNFSKGRPTLKEWCEEIIKAIPYYIPENIASTESQRKKFRKFKAEAARRIEAMDAPKTKEITIVRLSA
jgi:hypothetical protein